MEKNELEKLKDLKAVYSGALEAGELSIANMIKGGIDLIEKLQRENEELKYTYDKALSDVIAGVDLDNTYISKQKVKDKIEEYKKLGNEFYEKFLETNKTDINIHDAGIACDSKVQALQELLEEKGE